MVKAEWGVKRTCQSCSAKFYDMRREPVLCPKCGVVQDLEAVTRPRRSRAAPVAAEPKPPKPVPKRPTSDEEALVEASDLEVEVDKDDDEEEEVIEDASELGEDEDDVAEVIPGVNGEEER
ncbi:MAG: TIGR02300 family protein [Alphaproteobacteria bacterium]|nr:TIGR02300 family protein [Alphaproteobacteria bacterium]